MKPQDFVAVHCRSGRGTCLRRGTRRLRRLFRQVWRKCRHQQETCIPGRKQVSSRQSFPVRTTSRTECDKHQSPNRMVRQATAHSVKTRVAETARQPFLGGRKTDGCSADEARSELRARSSAGWAKPASVVSQSIPESFSKRNSTFGKGRNGES